jgi:hypothetical protein
LFPFTREMMSREIAPTIRATTTTPSWSATKSVQKRLNPVQYPLANAGVGTRSERPAARRAAGRNVLV